MIKRKVGLLHPELKPYFGQKPLLEFTSGQVMGQLQHIWPILPLDPSRCSSIVRILAKKHSSGQITTLVPIKQETVRKRQVIKKYAFLDSLWQLVDGSLLLWQSHVLFHSNKIRNNNGRWHKLDFRSWYELSHAVDLVGSRLNCSSSWPWLENHFLNEVIFMPQHQYVGGLLDLAQKNFWMINQFSISRYFGI
jgi:hypothetical protein